MFSYLCFVLFVWSFRKNMGFVWSQAELSLNLDYINPVTLTLDIIKQYAFSIYFKELSPFVQPP